MATCQLLSMAACQLLSIATCQLLLMAACQLLSIATCQLLQMATCQLLSMVTCQLLSMTTCPSQSIITNGSICSIARLLYGDMDGRGLGRRARQADRGSVVGATTAAAVADCKDWAFGSISSKGRWHFLLCK